MTIREITNYLETVAPLAYQESYDNSGLIVGNPSQEVKNVLLCLDSIETIIDEAIEKNCQLVIAHHPIVFSGLKKITGKNYIERTILKAIKNDIAIYACHTNLDNVLQNGVNQKIANKLSLHNQAILAPKSGELQKLVSFVPTAHKEEVLNNLFQAGAGHIGNYSHCSFSNQGKGSFKAGNYTNPFVGKIGETHFEDESRIEVIYPKHLKNNIISTLIKAHPYEEVAYDIYNLENQHSQVGSGIVGELEQATPVMDFLESLKLAMNVNCVRYTKPHIKEVKKIAVCGGSGSFLLGNAIANQADVFITADYKYHQFFDADNKIIIADIGHFESEQYTINLFEEILSAKFQNLNFVKTEITTNPVLYL